MTFTGSRNTGSPHVFGGDWTTQKLQVLSRYLQSYTTALRYKPTPDRPFRKTFIDAFAGSGYRTPTQSSTETVAQEELFPELAASGPQGLLEGSARLALDVDPPFEKYVFVEKNAGRCHQLAQLKSDFPARADTIDIRLGDANVEIQRICRGEDWSGQRAVLFLDPYGMQVDWKTIEAVAATKAIDLWLLFPLGIGVNRLLTKSGTIPDTWRDRLTALLGTENWYEEFYKVEATADLLGDVSGRVIKASMDVIGAYFLERLSTVFAGVVEQPGVLRNSSNNPLYLLCFAVGNERGKPIAIRIAKHLLKDLR
ncbi:three-Cys-motif partner protein TcmP [Peristeroidobacter soli]|jgi:three-Cys-motif partner protein|uniref:three-Cys-motif partner protein TcmP n=1 Tax=Peristeroidobacter soli TaxID=2497877 RepID=UPI00101BCEB2|nr:three-Cys-motif partner protein TcmP [Peristeroidobacter soli]